MWYLVITRKDCLALIITHFFITSYYNIRKVRNYVSPNHYKIVSHIKYLWVLVYCKAKEKKSFFLIVLLKKCIGKQITLESIYIIIYLFNYNLKYLVAFMYVCIF